jgi:hypothetical protein
MTKGNFKKIEIVQNNLMKITILLLLLLQISSLSVASAMFLIGLGTGVFIVISLAAVIFFILNKTVGKK